MQNGSWIILDELNLAPSDILEALNRLLDDNREIFIPETQETIKAHPSFQLFATQNPPGTYAGRKQLSRAFRNRFLELHFSDLPLEEIEVILEKRCSIPQKYAKKLVDVMRNLTLERRSDKTFQGKNTLITLRDLFKWADRYTKDSDTGQKDWEMHLMKDGYMILAGRCRNDEEKRTIQNSLEKVFRKAVDNPDELYHKPDKTYESSIPSHFLITESTRRSLFLVARAVQFDEPVLLIGPTSSVKKLKKISISVHQLIKFLINQKSSEWPTKLTAHFPKMKFWPNVIRYD